ncbi:MAG TPA: response regulator transcription factor [Actinomycetales bacterium]|nr:response regulator transcription factor [Actinomycetales bacterium]
MRLIIAEDSVLLRAGLERLLTDAGHEIVGSLGTAEQLVATAAREAPDLAIVDVRMPPTFTDEGIRAAVLLRDQSPEVAILVLSQYVEERYASELIATSTKGLGYLLKERVADVEEFLEAVTTVASGGTVLDPEVVAQIVVRSHRTDDLGQLTGRERDVLELMAQGKSNSAIAKGLFISEGSVEKHVSSIFSKLGLLPAESENRRVMAVLRYLES